MSIQNLGQDCKPRNTIRESTKKLKENEVEMEMDMKMENSMKSFNEIGNISLK